MLPKKIPNLNQSLLRGVNIFELLNPNIRKIIDIINDQILMLFSLSNGHKDIIKNTIKKLLQNFC